MIRRSVGRREEKGAMGVDKRGERRDGKKDRGSEGVSERRGRGKE